MKTVIVMPAFNESAVIADVVLSCIKQGFTNILVIDDGSSDNTGSLAGSAGALVITHAINRGKGAATETGLAAAKQLGADIIVTIDSDGQHSPSDIKALISPIEKGQTQITLGTRSFNQKNMPKHKIIQNKAGNFITWAIYGLWVSDSQSGMRAYSRLSLDQINPGSKDYEYESKVISEIHKHKLSYLEVPISVKYTEHSSTKNRRQNLLNGVKTVYKMLWEKIS